MAVVTPDCLVVRGGSSISLLTATCLVVANMIGTGVFTSLGFQVGALPSGFTLMTLWLLGGLCAFCGALAYGELAAALPRSGGEYHLLSAIYHPAVGFMAGWVSATVGFAAPVALAAMAFGNYFQGIFPGNPTIPVMVSSMTIVLLVTVVHLRGRAIGSVFQVGSTLLKVLLVAGLVVAGILFANPQPVSFLPAARDARLILSPPFAVSLVYVMYAYSGWNAAVYVSGEIQKPGRNLPLSLGLGTALVTLLYMGLNATFLRAAPMDVLDGKLDVGHVAAGYLFGPSGARLMAALVCAGLLSCISAMTWVGPRVAMAMGEDLRPLRWLAHKSGSGIPTRAILLQSTLVLGLLLSATFEAVLTYLQFSIMACSFLAVLGVFVLRRRQPDLVRPYKAWAYPWTPLFFLAVHAWILVHIATSRPLESFAGFATMLLGLVIYWLGPVVNRQRPNRTY